MPEHTGTSMIAGNGPEPSGRRTWRASIRRPVVDGGPPASTGGDSATSATASGIAAIAAIVSPDKVPGRPERVARELAVVGLGAGGCGQRDEIAEGVDDDLGSRAGQRGLAGIAHRRAEVAADAMEDVHHRPAVGHLQLLTLGRD